MACVKGSRASPSVKVAISKIHPQQLPVCLERQSATLLAYSLHMGRNTPMASFFGRPLFVAFGNKGVSGRAVHFGWSELFSPLFPRTFHADRLVSDGVSLVRGKGSRDKRPSDRVRKA